MSDKKSIEFEIKDIRQIEFFVDESKNIGQKLEIVYNVDVNINKSTIRVSINTIFQEKEGHGMFMRGTVETCFSIKDIMEYVIKKENGNSVVIFPEHFWLNLFSIAFSHARAVLAVASARTKFRDYLLPIINPSEEFKKSFPGEVEFLTT